MARKTFTKKVGRGTIESTAKSLLDLVPTEKTFRRPRTKTIKTTAKLRRVGETQAFKIFDIKFGKLPIQRVRVRKTPRRKTGGFFRQFFAFKRKK